MVGAAHIARDYFNHGDEIINKHRRNPSEIRASYKGRIRQYWL